MKSEKLQEIKWRLENRTAAYLSPGCDPDTVAHDDMEWLVQQLEHYQQATDRVIADINSINEILLKKV